MKGKIIGKILIILLAIVMVLPLSAFAASAEEIPNTNNVPGYIQDIYRNGRTPQEQAEYEDFIRLMKMKEDASRIDAMFPKEKRFDPSGIEDGLKIIRQSLPGIVQTIKDAENGGDFDTAACVDNVVSLVSNIASCCGPYGQLVASVVNLGNAIFKMAMGGESATSEMAQMEDRLTQQLDDIQNQLSDIEDQINDLSNEINESTNTIISEVTSAIDNADAKAYLRTFMLSGEGNFSYNQYRNYIYGASTGNSKANTAYYALLKQSITNDASDEITKYYYDQLYTAIMNDRDVYCDYIMGSDDSKSIVQYYYDVVSARPDLMNESGMTAEYAAIMFAYDIYQTELMANQIIATCNLYQYAQMCLSGEEYYCYDQSTGKIVTLADIDGAEGIDSIQEQINIRIDEIHDQLASDIAYILNLDDSYIVESADGDLFEVVNSDPDTYGKVLAGQTIYLNTIPEEICDLFGFDANDFSYVVSVPTDTDGVFYVDSNANRIEATLYYNGEELDAMSFTVGANPNNFNGGNGTASDPYLIASAAQFASISDGLDKHYRLICDIDFNGATITPIGQKVNSNDAIVYDEFVGSLDGNGYTISNLNVVGHTNAGIFGIIGETGEVADLKLYNVKVSTNITNAEKSTSEFYAGMIAGKNNGIIKYCSVDSDGTVANSTPVCGVFYDVNNSTKNRNIYGYTGGIAGSNNYAVVGCTVENIHISGSSTHNFGGDKTSTNKNNVYVGGVCGYSYGAITHSIVKESVKISSYAKSIYNPETTVNPYVVAHAGGIVAKVNSLSDICQVESNAQIIHNDAELDCESKWGEHYNNCSDEKDTYIPKYSEDELKAIIATESVEAFIAKTERNYTVTFECPDTVYEAGSDAFKTDNLKFFINGVEKEYEIVDIYGFDAQNEEFDNIPQNIVVLFSVEIEGETVYFAQDITVTIEKNVVTSIEILNLKDSYVKDTFSLEGLVIKHNYAVGNPEYVTINSENISQVRYFGNITTFGTQSIALLYNGDTVEFEINVVCGHGNNFTSSASGYAYNESLSQAPTCYSIGYNAYVCGTCGDIQYFYLRKTEHVPHECDHNFIDGTCDICGAKEATCTEEGNTGKVLCADENCGSVLKKDTVLKDSAILKDGTILEAGTILENDTFIRTVLIDGKVIPKLTHHYVYVDGDKHACTNGSHSEYHHYTVTESVQLLDPDKNGTKEWYIVYTYTCICQKENGEQYSKIEIDENSVTNETKELPTIAISNGYVTSGGKEVVVYVQLTNNPGLKSAVFGIRYDRGLELVGDPQIGNLFKNLTINEKEQIDYGYNFVFANAALVSGNGNLVKLTFKVTDEAKIGHIYNISVVYNEMGKSIDGTPIMGGFSNGEQINVVTRDGYVKVVGDGQLPGDVNNDNIVDLMDAVLLAKFYANSENYPLSTEDADIDLDRKITPDDIVALLEYLIGGYGTNLLTQDFEIVLNTNGYGDVVLNDLLVSIYDTNNTYDAAGLNTIIAEIENRTGYKFLGWYDQMVGGNLVFGGDKTEDILVVYNENQKKQTLYAHWELNQIHFASGGATHGNMDDIFYTDGQFPSFENTFERKYQVRFVLKRNETFKDTWLYYDFVKFVGDNGEEYFTMTDVLLALQTGHYGCITLTPVWDETSPKLIEYPTYTESGYKEARWSKEHDYLDEVESIADIRNAIYDYGNNRYVIYVMQELITFDIIFDWNGGESNGITSYSPNHSVENPYLFNPDSISRQYFKFVGWKNVSNNEIYDGLTPLGYVYGADSGNVTLQAQWMATHYCIRYYPGDGSMFEVYVPISKTGVVDDGSSLHKTGWKFNDWNTKVDGSGFSYIANSSIIASNTGNSNIEIIELYAQWAEETYTISYEYVYSSKNKVVITTSISSEATQIYTYANAESINIPIPEIQKEYLGYISFAGWYEDGKPFKNDLSVNPRDVTLVAQWDGFDYTIYDSIANTPKDITEKKVIINWANSSSKSVEGKKLILSNTVSNLVVIGSPDTIYSNTSIALINFKNKQILSLYISNFNYEGYTSQTNILGLFALGSSSDCNMILNINVSGNSSIKTTGIGQDAINLGMSSELNITGDGDLRIYGGDGDFSCYGDQDGGSGISVGTLTISMSGGGSLIVTGGNGDPNNPNHGDCGPKDGTDGSDGEAGANGGNAINASHVVLNSGTVSFNGGNGGAGSNGGCCNPDWFAKEHGGDGGNGGTGGTGVSADSITVVSGALTIKGGNGGNGGKAGGVYDNQSNGVAGSTGSGGAAGKAVSTNCVIVGACNSSDGSSGQKGSGTGCKHNSYW